MRVPYKGIKVEWQSDKDLYLYLPWVTIILETTEEDRVWVGQAIADFDDQPYSPEAQRFLENLSNYPISYLAPRKQADVKELGVVTFSLPPSFDLTTPRTFAHSMGAPSALVLECQLNWSWELHDILDACRMEEEGAYDPLSVISYLESKKLDMAREKQSSYRAFRRRLEDIKQENKDQFFKVIAWLVTQNYYKSLWFKECVTPALFSFENGRKTIEEFIAIEEDYTQNLKKFLEFLAPQEEGDNLISSEILFIMNALKWTAHACPLAFLFLIEGIEKKHQHDESLISDLLKEGVNMDIPYDPTWLNKGSQEMSLKSMLSELMLFLPLQNKDSLICAVRLLELVMYFDYLPWEEQEVLETALLSKRIG